MNINATLIGQSIAFLVFVWFCMQYVWPPIIQALTERQQKIADGISASEQADENLIEAQKKVDKRLYIAKSEAQAIVEQASKEATQVIDDAKVTAKKENHRIVQAAQVEIDLNVGRAREQLRFELATLIIVGAEKVLEKEIDKSINSELVDKLVSEL